MSTNEIIKRKISSTFEVVNHCYARLAVKWNKQLFSNGWYFSQKKWFVQVHVIVLEHESDWFRQWIRCPKGQLKYTFRDYTFKFNQWDAFYFCLNHVPQLLSILSVLSQKPLHKIIQDVNVDLEKKLNNLFKRLERPSNIGFLKVIIFFTKFVYTKQQNILAMPLSEYAGNFHQKREKFQWYTWFVFREKNLLKCINTSNYNHQFCRYFL